MATLLASLTFLQFQQYLTDNNLNVEAEHESNLVNSGNLLSLHGNSNQIVCKFDKVLLFKPNLLHCRMEIN